MEEAHESAGSSSIQDDVLRQIAEHYRQVRDNSAYQVVASMDGFDRTHLGLQRLADSIGDTGSDRDPQRSRHVGTAGRKYRPRR